MVLIHIALFLCPWCCFTIALLLLYPRVMIPFRLLELCPWYWFLASEWTLSMVLIPLFWLELCTWCWFLQYHNFDVVLISTLPPTVHGADALIVFSEWDGFLYFCFSGNDFYNTAAAWTCWWLKHYQNPFIMLHDADFNKSIALVVVLKFSPIIIPILLHSTACVYFLVKSIQYFAANL